LAPLIQLMYLGCAGGDFTECWTLALSIQDLDQKLKHLLMEINVDVVSMSRALFISGYLYKSIS